MKVSELTGELLDIWVARAAGVPIKRRADGFLYTDEDHARLWQPSTFWDLGGPIIERENIGTGRERDLEGREYWAARVGELWLHEHDQYVGGACGSGPTLLIAAMRAFVASKLGEDVPDDEGVPRR
jgi:hypothetical protein